MHSERSDLLTLNDNKETILNFKANFDKSLRNKDLVDAILFYSDRVDWNTMTLDSIVNKINLLEQIRK